MLFVTVDYMARMQEKMGAGSGHAREWTERSTKLAESTREFCFLSKQLLLEEKIATQTGILSKLGKVNERVDKLRGDLFGTRMNHGGLCRSLFDLIDSMLLNLIRLAG